MMDAHQARFLSDLENDKPCFSNEIEEAARKGLTHIIKPMYQHQLESLVDRGFNVEVYDQEKVPYNLYKISW